MRVNADVEKTQAPIDEATYRLIQERERDYNRCGAQTAQPMSNEEILAELFKYHPPTADALPKYAAINQAAKNFAEVILQNCPSCSDRSAAINCIRMARMIANAAIALNGLSL
jgi:hypothetical protein